MGSMQNYIIHNLNYRTLKYQKNNLINSKMLIKIVFSFYTFLYIRFNNILFKKAALAIKRSANVSFFLKLVLTSEERNEQGFEKQYNINLVSFYCLRKPR